MSEAFNCTPSGDIEINRDLSIREVREVFRISHAHVYELIRRGDLRTFKLGRLTRVRREDLNRLRNGKSATAAA